jgi:hypothetical protein
MAKVTVYSKYPVGVQFTNPNNGHEVEFKGVNSHKLEFDNASGHHKLIVPENLPYSNLVDEEDWLYFKDKYGNRSAYFDKLNGDCFYTAKDEKEAISKNDNTKKMIDDKFIVSKQKGISKQTKGE